MNVSSDDMEKVLHVLASNKYSGAENVVCTIIDNFKKEYDMAYCSLIGPIEEELCKRKIKYYGIKKLNITNLKKVIKQYNPDIIHAHDYTASVIVALSGFRGKIISHLHNNCPFAKKWNLKSLLYNLTIKKYTKVIGVSDKVYEEAVFKKNLNKKYNTIYNYIDSDLIIKKSREYEFQKKYDFFFFGRLTKQKNPLEFIEIIKDEKKKNKNVKAVMIGDGLLKEKCNKYIIENNLVENIEILGFISNPFPIIRNCKIGIMPSLWEGFGLTVIESLILNKPVYNSGVGGLGEIFKDNNEFICTSHEDYLERINCNAKYKFEKIVEKFCDKEEWKNKIRKCYE